MPFLDRAKIDRMSGGRSGGAGRFEDAPLWGGDEYKPSGADRLRSLMPTQGQRRLCSSPECANTWTAPWRNRRRPIFEGQWGCSGRCVLALVRAAVDRETGEGDMVATPHRHRVPLGLVMLAQGWITHPQLRQALEAQRAHGRGRIGDWLVTECGLEAEQITRGLSMQWGCPVLPVTGFDPEAMALVMPKLFVEKLALLPLRLAGPKVLYLGFEDHLNASAALAIEQMSDLKVESGLVDGVQFRAARSKLLDCKAVEAKLEGLTDIASLAARVTAILEDKRPVASRLVRLHQFYWLRLWLEAGAMGRNGNLPRTGEDVIDHVFTVGTQA